jgi:3-oxoacyl-[acyl-carrier protein] reductase
LLGGNAVVIQNDISKENDCQSLINSTIAKFGRLDVLINNAATTKFAFDHSNLDALNTEDFLKIYTTNVIGPYNLIKYSRQYLLQSPSPSIVNVASIAGITGIGSSIAYAASKGALITMTLSMARSLGPIRVNAVCPGFIQGEWLKNGLGNDKYEKIKSTLESTNPLQRTCTPEDIANAIYFFAEGQQVITGETMIIDGGTHLSNSRVSTLNSRNSK